MDIQAIIFDMDGLMFDTERLSMTSWQRAAEDKGFQVEPEMMLTVIGRTATDTKKIIIEHFGQDFPYEDIKELTNQYATEEITLNGVPIKKGLMELLEHCKQSNILLAVATSTDRKKAEALLKQANIYHYFDAIVCGDEIINGKPEPDIFLAACEKLNIKPDQCFILEDSEHGIVAASKAGSMPIFIPDLIETSPAIETNSHAKCASLLDVIEMLNQSNI